MKEETKRFYKFTFDELKQKLKIKGDKPLSFSDKDDRGKDSDTLTIITVETKEGARE